VTLAPLPVTATPGCNPASRGSRRAGRHEREAPIGADVAPNRGLRDAQAARRGPQWPRPLPPTRGSPQGPVGASRAPEEGSGSQPPARGQQAASGSAPRSGVRSEGGERPPGRGHGPSWATAGRMRPSRRPSGASLPRGDRGVLTTREAAATSDPSPGAAHQLRLAPIPMQIRELRGVQRVWSLLALDARCAPTTSGGDSIPFHIETRVDRAYAGRSAFQTSPTDTAKSASKCSHGESASHAILRRQNAEGTGTTALAICPEGVKNIDPPKTITAMRPKARAFYGD
jgi:hypothetical protein